MGKDGPYEQFCNPDNKLVGQAQLPMTIAGSILTSGFSPATFWYPLAVYVGLLLSKTLLKTYCKTGEIKYPQTLPIDSTRLELVISF